MPSMREDLSFRRIEPELLDSLSTNDPRAIKSRRDLIRINALMFHASIMAGLLKRNLRQKPTRILEIGAGDGTFMLAIARRLAKTWPNVELVLLDQANLVSNERRGDFRKLGWQVETVTADIFRWIDRSQDACYDAITANLFLHHFQQAALTRLFLALCGMSPVFLATEPRRSAIALGATRLLGAIGANDVTLHDAAASVRGGFSGNDLSTLWPTGIGVLTTERRIGPFTHVFTAKTAWGTA
jgi:hypothetical protein